MSGEANRVIEVEGVTKTYRTSKEKHTAIKNISFSLDHGEDLAIIGPSGSGKTTLLQIMGGLAEPTSGTVKIDGQPASKGSDNYLSTFRNKKIGFIFQNIYLQDYLTAQENVMLPMLIGGMRHSAAQRRAAELLESVGLGERLHYRPHKLSGGEEQRVAIARALANHPQIIFADEPTAKLDAENTQNILQILSQINKDGVCLIVITHDEKVAKHFHKHIYLEHGQITKQNF